jgi:hypothetical protein
MAKLKIAILICSFNESRSVLRVIKEASRHGKVLLVNDGSTDNTEKIIKNLDIYKIKNKINEGYENCINKGLIFLKSKNYDYAITLDADGQHKISDLRKIITLINAKNYDFVITKRKNIKKLNEKILSKITKKKIGLSDILSGLKAYKLNIFTKQNIKDLLHNDVAATNYLIAILKRKKNYIEILISSKRRVYGKSKFYSKIKNKIKIFSLIIKMLFYRYETR